MKNAKTTWIALLSACICMACLFVAGCKKEEERPEIPVPQNCDVVLEACVDGPLRSYNFTIIFMSDSYEGITETLSLYGIEDIDVYDYDSDKETDPTFDYAVKHALENKIYVVYLEYRMETNDLVRIKEVEVTGGKLTMYVQLPNDFTFNQVPSYTLLIAAVDETYVTDVSSCDYEYVRDTDFHTIIE